jgi:CRP/FNR family cyclic AMP-dependent transcriptional regulator
MATMTEGAKRDVLAATPIFAFLSRDELTALAALAVERRVRRDQAVVRRGDSDASLLILVAGRLRAGSVSADGREVTIGVMEAGAVLGEIALLDGRPRSLDVTAMTESTLLVVDRRDFLPFLKARPDLMLRLMALLCERLRKASKAFEDVALAPLSARLARLLLGLAAEHGARTEDGIRIRIRVSQRDMSAQVAATRERVNKQLRQWHEAGVLGEQDGDLVVRRAGELRALLDADSG